MTGTKAFAHCKTGGVSHFVCRPLEALGLRHGFSDSTQNFVHGEDNASIAELCTAYGAATFLNSQQVHGQGLWDLRGLQLGDPALRLLPPKADAILLRKAVKLEGKPATIVGIKTADCIPIIVDAGDECALIHAGWRGLASALIPLTLEKLSRRDRLTLAIGPHAGPECYEVGAEVIAALGEHALIHPRSDGKALLDLGATCERMVRALYPEAVIYHSGLCTICGSNLHSYRRDGASSGRNLSYVVLG